MDIVKKVVREKFKEIKDIRGERGKILESAIDIENNLNTLISEYFAKKSKFDQFNKKVLNKEFFTFSQKIKLFKELQLHKKQKYKGKYNGYTEKLWQIDKTRNKFAHKKIVVGILKELENLLENQKEHSKIREEIKLYHDNVNKVHQMFDELIFGGMPLKIGLGKL